MRPARLRSGGRHNATAATAAHPLRNRREAVATRCRDAQVWCFTGHHDWVNALAVGTSESGQPLVISGAMDGTICAVCVDGRRDTSMLEAMFTKTRQRRRAGYAIANAHLRSM